MAVKWPVTEFAIRAKSKGQAFPPDLTKQPDAYSPLNPATGRLSTGCEQSYNTLNTCNF